MGVCLLITLAVRRFLVFVLVYYYAYQFAAWIASCVFLLIFEHLSKLAGLLKDSLIFVVSF